MQPATSRKRRRRRRAELYAIPILLLVVVVTGIVQLLSTPGTIQSQDHVMQRLYDPRAGSTAATASITITSHRKGRNIQHKRPTVLPHDFDGLQLIRSKNDRIYRWGEWDEAPIVVESHKLIFFTIPKVGCTVFKQLFRRMYGYNNWRAHDATFPHQPIANGLNYLYHYKPSEAERMLTDESWTRAIFFRDPKERLLSAYLDKGLHEKGKYVRVHCCQRAGLSLKTLLQCQIPVEQIRDPLVTFPDFLRQVVAQCSDPHWRAQAQRLPDKYWPYINFVGHMESIESDTRRLLQKIDAWDDFGASGWESGAIFAGDASVAHATDASRKVTLYYTTPERIRLAESLHKEDYDHPIVGYSRKQRGWSEKWFA